MKRWQSLFIGLIVTVIALAFALNGTDLSKLGGVLATGQYLILIPVTALMIPALYIRAARWRVLLNDGIEIKHSFNISNAGYLFNNILPLRLGEVVRMFLAARLTPPVPVLTTISSIVIERLIDVLAMGVLIALAVVIAPLTQIPPAVVSAVRSGAVVAIIAAIALIIIASRRDLAHRLLDRFLRLVPRLERFNVRGFANEVLDGIAPLASGRGLALLLMWTVLAWGLSIIQVYILLYVFYPHPAWDTAFLIIPIGALAIALPAVPGSVGPFELAVVTAIGLSSLNNVPDGATRALAIAVIFHVIVTAAYVFMGVLGVTNENISFREIIKSASELAARIGKQKEQPSEISPS